MKKFVVVIISFLSFFSCKKDNPIQNQGGDSQIKTTFSATPYNITYPFFWSSIPISMPSNNPITVEGVALGRKLFYDPVLSQNNTMSCATCHNQAFAFTDNGKQFSDGLHGEKGKRNAPAIFNLGWFANYGVLNHGFFWDGGASDLESQAIGPITNPIEMSENLFNVIRKLKANPVYPVLFKKAFGTDSITSQLISFAIAQFERTIVSGNTKYDRYIRGIESLTPQEANGFDVFSNRNKGDCTHCHLIGGGFFTDFKFHNNGLQVSILDSGLARISKNQGDLGKFKTPSLRNLVFTSPYMHDGRFSTLEQVVDFYDSQAYLGQNVDPFITSDLHPTGLFLSTNDKKDLIAFLKTLTDSVFVNNPIFSKP
ncbi:MAG: cytochrome c peroxidase [Bacteroidota bacterium]